MADPEKKKRSRFGEEFHELFPQLLLPAGLGLISSYSRPAAVGVEMGMRAADLFSVMKGRAWEQEQQKIAQQAMLDSLERLRTSHQGKEKTVRDQMATTQDMDNAKATIEETAKFNLFGSGPTIAASKATPETLANAPDFNDLFSPGKFNLGIADSNLPYAERKGDAFAPPSLEAAAGPGIEKWLATEKPTAADIPMPEKFRGDYDFMDIMTAAAMANPTVAAQMMGNWLYQERGLENELERVQRTIDMYSRDDTERQKYTKQLEHAAMMKEYQQRQKILEIERDMRREGIIPMGEGFYGRFVKDETGEGSWQPQRIQGWPSETGRGGIATLNYADMSDAALNRELERLKNSYANQSAKGLGMSDSDFLATARLQLWPVLSEMLNRDSLSGMAQQQIQLLGLAAPGGPVNPSAGQGAQPVQAPQGQPAQPPPNVPWEALGPQGYRELLKVGKITVDMIRQYASPKKQKELQDAGVIPPK